MSHYPLLQILGGFVQARVLILGDVMLDRFIYGTIKRISPEAPIPVLTIERETDMPGGAANVARNLSGAGACANLVGVVGVDEWAAKLSSKLVHLAGVEIHLIEDRSRPTTVKTRLVADGQQVLRADQENSKELSPQVEQRLLAAYESALADSEIVILSDYAKGVLSNSVLAQAISIARRAGKRIIVDPKSESFEKYRGATVLTPNRHELQAACRFECATDEAVVRGARQILEEGICEILVVTRGKDGMSMIRSNGDFLHLRTTAREVFDVSGAGDTVVATMTAAIAAGADIGDACTLANLAAGIVVGKHGTAIATSDEMIAALRPQYGPSDTHQLFSQDRAVRMAQDWRNHGLTVAFTNGCFDLLHPGHISLLDQARREADRLIVGINSDASVRRLKGPARPLQSEIARATVLASLKSVDAVVIFEEDTPLQLIEVLNPDVLVKGADYTVDQVVGADFVAKRGGRVFLAELIPGHSTTSTLKRAGTLIDTDCS
jgi:D-beta-D-heptose 7-phosphate kinase/D-beta-D-heptose 1-phosphate adenosyltransferase